MLARQAAALLVALIISCTPTTSSSPTTATATATVPPTPTPALTIATRPAQSSAPVPAPSPSGFRCPETMPDFGLARPDAVVPSVGRVCSDFYLYVTGLPPGATATWSLKFPGDADFSAWIRPTVAADGHVLNLYRPERCVFGPVAVRIAAGGVVRDFVFTVREDPYVDCSSGRPVFVPAFAPPAESTVSGKVTWFEQGMSDMQVELAQLNGTALVVVASTRTDGSGHYSFAGLRAGAYHVRVPAQAGFSAAEGYDHDYDDDKTRVDGKNAFKDFPIWLVKPLRVVAPADGATINGPFAFTWEPVAVAIAYHVQVLIWEGTCPPSCANAVVNSGVDSPLIVAPSGEIIGRGVKATSYTVPALKPGHYRWRVTQQTDEAYVYERGGDRSSSPIAEASGTLEVQ